MQQTETDTSDGTGALSSAAEGTGADSDDPASPSSARRPSRGPRVTVRLLAADEDPPLAPYLRGHLRQAAAMAGVHGGRLTVAVVDDPRMVALHERHLGSAATTDVLTFDLRDGPDGPVDADIVVCLDEARRQASGRGHGVHAELLLYAVHGLLHLLGADDRDAAAAAAMHEREDDLLGAIGVGPVFRTGRGGP